MCHPGGGTGRHAGLKILFAVMRVTVQFRSRVQSLSIKTGAFSFMYFVYILYSKTYDRYYIGQCQELSARLTRHNTGVVLSTKAYRPWEIVYSENYATRAADTIREKEIKNKKSRKYIEYLLSK